MLWINILLWGSCLYLLFPLIVRAPLLKKTHWIARHCSLRPRQASERSEIGDWLAQRRPAIEQEEFIYLGDFVMEHFTSQITTYFALYRHTETGLAALSVWVDHPMQTARYEEVSQSFCNQRTLTVNNSPVAMSWSSKGKEIRRFPWLKNFHELLAMHRFICSLNPLYSEAQPLAVGQELDFLKQYIDSESEKAIQAGIYRIGRDSQRLELTWKGSMYMVWKNTFPGKQLMYQ